MTEKHLKILNVKRLPACYGVSLAQSFVDNEMLNKYWSDFLMGALYYSQLGVLAKPIADQFQGQYAKRIMEIVDEELEKKRRDEVESCDVCGFKGGSMISALLLIIDPKRWFTEQDGPPFVG